MTKDSKYLDAYNHVLGDNYDKEKRNYYETQYSINLSR